MDIFKNTQSEWTMKHSLGISVVTIVADYRKIVAKRQN
jgi:hypothetical protein